MKPGLFNRISFYLLILLVLIAACDSDIPSPPLVTVVVTVVDDTQALSNAVTQAIGGTESAALAQTATVFAQGGVTLTPSSTPTASPTPTLAPTRFVTATRTPLPSETPTSTYVPFLTNTPPAPDTTDSTSWVRVLNGWRGIQGQQASVPLDIYVNDERISRSLNVGEQTPYIQVSPGAIRINLRTVDSNLQPTPEVPLVSNVVDIPVGTVMSFLAVDLGNGLTLMPIPEDISPISSGMARLTIVQANAELFPVDMLLSNLRRSLAYNFSVGQIVGPMEVPGSTYSIDLYETDNTNNSVQELTNIGLAARLNYILVLAPFRGVGQDFTDTLLFSGTTRLLSTDVAARFINVATRAGALTLQVGADTLFTDLPIGSISDPVPISTLGSDLQITNSNDEIISTDVLGPWQSDGEVNADKIFMLSDNPTISGNPIAITEMSQNPPTSSINASLRLIHALPGGIALGLEVRSLNNSGDGADNPWIPIAQANLGTASNYVSRAPDVFDVRVVQAGTRTDIATLQSVQLLAGGVYDFVVLPGSEVGSARLVLIQPTVQIATLDRGADNSAFVAEAVQATLSALVTDVSPTPTGVGTATPTLTPVATNTPRPTNTPSVPPPALSVNPAPPDATGGVVTVIGQNFAPGKPYSVRVDNITVDLANGVVGNNGTIGQIITLPSSLTPGPHTVRVCVDCLTANGLKQEQFAVVILADPRATPTATAQS